MQKQVWDQPSNVNICFVIFSYVSEQRVCIKTQQYFIESVFDIIPRSLGRMTKKLNAEWHSSFCKMTIQKHYFEVQPASEETNDYPKTDNVCVVYT